MITPVKLKKGDTIGLIAASKCIPKESVEPAVKAIEALGLNVVVGETCYSRHGYLAGHDKLRADDINTMFADGKINGIFMARGGYGAQRLMDLLDYDMISKNPKIFCGYSDVTAFLVTFSQKCGFITYHSPMATTELKKGLDEYSLKSYLNNLFNDKPVGEFENLPGVELKTLYHGKAEGRLVGGNLSLLASSLGTKYEVDTKDKIIFIEEVHEEPYRIDRMLVQMKLAGKFKDCAGILLGAFTDCTADKPDVSLTLEQVIEELIVSEKKPVICNISCGHVFPSATLAIGANVKMDAGNKEIIFTES